MRTNFDVLNIVYARLTPGPLATALTGSVYKVKRKLGSTKEDCVINSLPIDADELQTCFVNVNIHVPDEDVPGEVAETVGKSPNMPRLKALTDIAVGLLTDVYGDDYNYTVQHTGLFESEVPGEHYSNIRIEFKSINNSLN